VPARPDRAIWVGLAVVTVVGTVLRLYGLDHQSLWNDELSTWQQLRFDSWREMLIKGVPVYHLPAFWSLLYFWIHYAGDSETSLRLPSALLGIAAIPAMFALGRRLYGQREGLIAAALTATAWMPIFYSQEARPYMLLFLLVALSSAWLIDVVHGLRRLATPPRGAAVAYVITASLTCYTHYFGLLFVCLQAALVGLLFLRQPRALGWVATLYAVVLLSCVPWLRRASVAVADAPAWIEAPDASAPWQLLRFLFNESSLLAVLALVLWATLLAREYWTRRQPGGARFAPATLLLLAWLIVPVVIVYVRSVLAAPAFLNRTLIIVAPAAYLLLARAVAQLSERRWAAPLAAGALCGGLLVQLIVVQRYYTRPTKGQFREAAAYLIAHDQPDVPTLILACAHNRNYFNYYLERLGSPRRVDGVVVTAPDGAVAQQLIAERAPAHVWLLAGHLDPDPALLAALSSQLRLVDESHFLKAGVWHFSR